MGQASFEKLEVYQRSLNLSVKACQFMDSSKNFGLKDLMIRSSISIPSNIAEGAERTGNAEFNQFLSYVKGSAGELRCQISIACSLGVVDKVTAADLTRELGEIFRML